MKYRIFLLCLMLPVLPMLVAPGVAMAQPELETTIEVTGTGWRFAGRTGSDIPPDLLEIVADGEARITLVDSRPDAADNVVWTDGFPSWGSQSKSVTNVWPYGSVVPGANLFLTVRDGQARPISLRGTGVDSVYVEFITATKVDLSCTKGL